MGDNTDFASGSTFAGTPAGCAAAIKTLQIFERDHIVAHAKRLGKIAAGIMHEWEAYSIVRQARGNGLLLGVSFGKPESADGDEKGLVDGAGRSRKDARERCMGNLRSSGHDSNVSSAQYGGIRASRRAADYGRRDPARPRNTGTRKAMRWLTQPASGVFSHGAIRRSRKWQIISVAAI